MQQCVPEGIRALWLTGDLLPDRPSDASVTRVISQALPSFLRWQGCKGFQRGHRAQSHHLRSPDCLCLGGEELPVVTEAIASIPVIGGVLDPQHFATQQHAGESKDGPWKELRVLGEGKLAYFQEVLLSQSG